MGGIAVQKVGKSYKIYANAWVRLLEWLSPVKIKRHSAKWVLQDITFEVKPGEALGIIGINGAGKSTLLKIITGILQPTVGHVQLTGKVAALLELGMGFHPEFTGKQNVLMAGQLLGYSSDQILLRMHDIETFAEIGKAIDEPVRTYSSGMQVRLAFSIATAFRPDILIVDEALSVGDAYFQHKSFERIRQFRQQGTTLLLVSHDKAAIQAICDRAILLEAGRIVKEGFPEEVMDFYNALIAKKENVNVEQRLTESGKVQTVSGTGEATVADIKLLNAKSLPVDVVDVGEMLTLQVHVRIHSPIRRLILGYMIKDRLGQVIYGTNTQLKNQPLEDLVAGQVVVYSIQFPINLGPGSYSISTALVSSDTHLDNNFEWRDLALVFNVVNLSHTHFAGCAWLDPLINIELGK